MILTEGLSIELRHVGVGLLVTLEGVLDTHAAPALRDALTWPSGTCAPRLYIDMNEVQTVDIEGMHLIEELCEGDAHVVRNSEALIRLSELVA